MDVVPLQFVFGSRASRVSGRHISSRTPVSDVAAIRESPLNVTRHPPDFQVADRWPSSRTQSSRPPNRVTTFHDSGASAASVLLHNTHAHSADTDDANMSTARSATSIVTLKQLRFIIGTRAARGFDLSAAHADPWCRGCRGSFVLLPRHSYACRRRRPPGLRPYPALPPISRRTRS